MLKNARCYEKQLQEKMRACWYDVKYQHYFADGFYDIEFGNDDRWYFVSVDRDDKVTAYITFYADMKVRQACSFGAVSFIPNNIAFARDVEQLVYDIFNKYHFNRLEWCCTSGNPVYRAYKRFCDDHGGEIVACEHECTRTLDGELRDMYMFEILARNYSRKKRKEDAT